MAPASASAEEAILMSMSSSSSNIVESGGAIWKGTTTRAVCVMDASGPLGSSLVHRLLLRGYSVHAAFHNRAEMHSFQRICICSAGPAGGVDRTRLKVFHSDPLDYPSILDALKGCCGLFYSFQPPSPSDHDHRPSYHDELMAEMEVRAAHNVLEACAQTHTIDKVVFTSSATAVIWSDRNNNDSNMPSPPPPPPPHDIDEKNWSNVNFCKKFKLWHGLSKTLAERTAWALAVDRGVNMVSINGGLLMTPDLTITSPYLKGAAEMYEDGVFVTVDLRFLVDSHICVFEDISAYGRYLSFNHVIDSNDKAIKLAHMLLPPDHHHHHHSASDSALPTDGEESREGHPQRISNKKLSKLMLDFDHTTARVPT